MSLRAEHRARNAEFENSRAGHEQELGKSTQRKTPPELRKLFNAGELF
jgi:hypothetical protein